ncbi:ABC transporter permease subunit [Rummeliibacillus sp. NPDC094406]|uniref:ABC transporter permease subunit n=1 Tax=Rummeliibacillus sp. NPDC094406 TaxID=3364511 RepID=UPI0037FBA2B2
MNFSLYKHMMKVHLKGMMNYAIGSAFYMLLMVWVYPSIAENTKSLNDFMKVMPKGVMKAFGFENGFGSFESYISGEYYGVILTIILTIFCVMLPTQLMAKLVDQGSMAYLLATPTTRGKIAFTQASVLLTGVFLIMLITTISGFVGYGIFMKGENSFHAIKFIQLNIATLFLFIAVGGISFLISCLANDEKKALGISGVIAFGFFSLDMIGKISDKVEWLRNITIYSLFRPSEIVSGSADIVQTSIILCFIGILTAGIGILIFRKRNLPL